MRKYLEKKIASSGILIFKEKHGNRYFVCSTHEDYCKVAMKVLKERTNEKFCWYYDDPHEPETSLTKAKEIIANNDTEAAFEFLDDRADWEYEGFDIEYGEEY